jgi:hypothetical protein
VRVEADCVRKAKADDVQKVRVVGEKGQTTKRKQNKFVGGAVKPMVIFMNPVGWQCPVPPTQTRVLVVFVLGNALPVMCLNISRFKTDGFLIC